MANRYYSCFIRHCNKKCRYAAQGVLNKRNKILSTAYHISRLHAGLINFSILFSLNFIILHPDGQVLAGIIRICRMLWMRFIIILSRIDMVRYQKYTLENKYNFSSQTAYVDPNFRSYCVKYKKNCIKHTFNMLQACRILLYFDAVCIINGNY